MVKYFLSFDCATKTLGYILIKIDYELIDSLNANKVKSMLYNILEKKEITLEDVDYVQNIDKSTKECIKIIHLDCIDLFPGIPNKEITTVGRIKRLSEYTINTIMPLLNDLNNVTILIEFQMNQNVQSKAVSIALISLFYKYDCHLVNPSLKNKVYFTKLGHYSIFISKYKNNYTANKQHALQNFKDFELIFNQFTNISNAKKGHIADAFMQIFGYIIFPNKYNY